MDMAFSMSSIQLHNPFKQTFPAHHLPIPLILHLQQPCHARRLYLKPSAKSGVVITGGTRGLGYALAREFLAVGAGVAICGRDEKRLQGALTALQTEYEGAMVVGRRCDVSKPQDVSEFASFAANALGLIKIWLNNAGEVTSKRLLTDVKADEVVRVCNTNVLGSLLCCREAVRIMSQQPPSDVPVYHIFNMGFSRWGAKFTRSACTHKTTKVALTQLSVSLNEELKNAGTRKQTCFIILKDGGLSTRALNN